MGLPPPKHSILTAVNIFISNWRSARNNTSVESVEDQNPERNEVCAHETPGKQRALAELELKSTHMHSARLWPHGADILQSYPRLN